MELSFDPKDSYVDQLMKLSDEKLKEFFESLKISEETFLYDCEA